MFICSKCGYIELSGSAPDSCPVCHVNQNAFAENNAAITSISNPEQVTDFEKKHTPLITAEACAAKIDFMVSVGHIKHPVEAEHYIAYIDLYVDEKLHGRLQFPASSILAPVAEVSIDRGENLTITAIACCNKHGTWRADVVIDAYQENGFSCRTCGKNSTKKPHLCSPSKTTTPYTCSHCGKNSDDAHHVCAPMLPKLSFVCGSCGRMDCDSSTLCYPKEIQDKEEV